MRNDLDTDPATNSENLKKFQEVLERVGITEKVSRSTDFFQTTIKFINPPREGKKLLVLDLDYTVFDYRSEAPIQGLYITDFILE